MQQTVVKNQIRILGVDFNAFQERLAERTRIAQDLHDTLLQGVLSASMQLYVVADQLLRLPEPACNESYFAIDGAGNRRKPEHAARLALIDR
jgi:signal transduction histidine kinase